VDLRRLRKHAVEVEQTGVHTVRETEHQHEYCGILQDEAFGLIHGLQAH
jgi:hypothetical protein